LRKQAAAGAAVLFALVASAESALAAIDCNPAPAHHHAAKHRRRHGPPKPHPAAKKPRAKVAPKPAGHECAPKHPVAVTLADIEALGRLGDADPAAPFADLTPGPGPTLPQAEAPVGGSELVSFGSPLSGGPSAGGSSGFPGGGPPGGGGSPPGGGGSPGGGEPGVPEPASWTMMLLGVGVVGARARWNGGCRRLRHATPSDANPK
jgi:hypothetical protein